MLTIEQQIEETDVKSILEMFAHAPYAPYNYQCAVYRLVGEQIAKYTHPFIVKASVSAGKTTMISMVCYRLQQLRIPALILSRQAEIVDQDAKELWEFDVKNSVFCSGLSMKSAKYPIICGSEKTVYNSLFTALSDFAPLVLGIDECQHVDVDDYLQSQERVFKTPERYDEDGTYHEATERKGETIEEMIEFGRSHYAIIIRVLSERCLERHNRTLRIFGLTGTDYRGVQPIINEDLETPGFWRFAVCDISTEFLVDFGAVVPTKFGDTGGLAYDIGDAFKSDGGDGAQDFSGEQLRKMQEKILKQGSMTEKIMLDVVEKTRHRNSVLITCAGKKHCLEAANALPEGSTYAVITDQSCFTNIGDMKKRRDILKEVFDGNIKYTFQVGCLTTGVNIPIWDTGVILRNIGSLTLLTQLIGRTMRKLKSFQIALGIIKHDALILDYSDTMHQLGELYFSPMLEQYTFEMAEYTKEFKHCEICKAKGRSGKNGEHARRCITQYVTNPYIVKPIGPGFAARRFHLKKWRWQSERCDYFWKYRTCDDVYDNTKKLVKTGCGTRNDIVARFCRNCGGMLIDPNDKLSGTHYSEKDYYDVLRFDIKPTQNNGILYEYMLQDPNDGRSFKAREFFSPESTNAIARKLWRLNGVLPHVKNKTLAEQIARIKNVREVMSYIAEFRSPERVTHRVNGKKKDVIHKKEFFDESATDKG